MRVALELPDDLAAEVDQRYLKEALVAMLYSTGKLSEKEGREILGMTRRAFEEMLPHYGVSILIDIQENLEIERRQGAASR